MGKNKKNKSKNTNKQTKEKDEIWLNRHVILRDGNKTIAIGLLYDPDVSIDEDEYRKNWLECLKDFDIDEE